MLTPLKDYSHTAASFNFYHALKTGTGTATPPKEPPPRRALGLEKQSSRQKTAT